MKNLYHEVEHLKEEIRQLKSHFLTTQNLSENHAENKIRELITEFKTQGQKTISIIDLIYKLHIPMEQANKIMEKLQKEGLVRDGD